MDIVWAMLLLFLHALAAFASAIGSSEVGNDKIWITDRIDSTGGPYSKSGYSKPIEMALSDYHVTRVKIPEFDSLLAVCRFRDFNPNFEVTWKRMDGHDFEVNGRLQAEQKGEYLRLTNVTRRHTGNYACTASDGLHPPKSRYMNLTVFYRPTVLAPKPRIGAGINASVVLRCLVESFPVVTSVEWSFANNPHPNMEVDNKLNHRQEHWGEIVESLLRIGPVSEKHYGDYICSARNLYGHDFATVSLLKESEVEKEESKENEPPAKLAEYVREGSASGKSCPTRIGLGTVILLLIAALNSVSTLVS